MTRLPEPPPRRVLVDLKADPYIVEAGTELWRIYPRAGRHPRAWNAFRSFGPVKTMRFDHHEEPAREQERKILYGASIIGICVAEFFQEDRTVDRFTAEPWLVGFTVARRHAAGPPRHMADQSYSLDADQCRTARPCSPLVPRHL